VEIVPQERRVEQLLAQRFEWTERQCEVMDLLARGKSNQDVADALGISLDGAKWHMRESLAKLGVDSRDDAAEWRRYNGWPRRVSGSLASGQARATSRRRWSTRAGLPGDAEVHHRAAADHARSRLPLR
jgi:DNA-binding CsgD family transcriptional regulator